METNSAEAPAVPVGTSSPKHTDNSDDDMQLDPLNQAIVIAPLPVLPPDGGVKHKVVTRKANTSTDSSSSSSSINRYVSVKMYLQV